VRDDIEPIFSKDFVDVKIDVDSMQGGKDLMDSLGATNAGVPFLVILRPDGSKVIDSREPTRGNIGSPKADWEIEYWNVMMRASAKRITEDEILYMAKTLGEV
jgi:hypothetical protein